MCGHMPAIALAAFQFERGLEYPALPLFPTHQCLHYVQQNLDFLEGDGFFTTDQRQTFMQVRPIYISLNIYCYLICINCRYIAVSRWVALLWLFLYTPNSYKYNLFQVAFCWLREVQSGDGHFPSDKSNWTLEAANEIPPIGQCPVQYVAAGAACSIVAAHYQRLAYSVSQQVPASIFSKRYAYMQLFYSDCLLFLIVVSVHNPSGTVSGWCYLSWCSIFILAHDSHFFGAGTL